MSREGRETLRPLLLLCALGVSLRLVLLWLAADIDFVRDEGHYVYLALTWNRFGFYADSHRFLWPPGYPFLLARGLEWFEMNGLLAVKVLQVAASGSIGLSTMLFARRLFGGRAATIAGLLWALYLPLAAYTHGLWTETLFLALLLPGLYQLAVVLDEPGSPADVRLVLAGALFAGALYLKDVALYLAPALALLLAGCASRGARVEGARRSLLFLLVVTVFVAPWTLRNFEVYGRFVPMGSSLGENVFRGLNGTYRNFDLAPFRTRFYFEEKASLESRSRRWFVAPPAAPDWERAEEILNTPDRLTENTRRGLAYARAHPGWLVRSRLKKLADFVSPITFVVRHAGLGVYEGTPLGGPQARRALLVWAVLCTLLVLPLGLAGGVRALRLPRPSRWIVLLSLGYFSLTSQLVSMSRFRVPAIPFLIALAAGFAASPRADPVRIRLGVAAGFGLLLALWWVDGPETLAILAIVWGGAA